MLIKKIRVFPRRTKWTPNDDLVFIGEPPIIGQPPTDLPVYVSCSFTWDINECERLYRSWSRNYETYIGGPGLGDFGGEFEPGLFIKPGVTITSRGCPKKCEFCFAWQREGNQIRELDIKEGHIIQDNNLLACSVGHFERVCEMLSKQKRSAKFMGMDAEFLTESHVKLLENIRVDRMFFSYDHCGSTYDIEKAGDLLSDYNRDKKRCYVLVGYNGESVHSAEKRLLKVWRIGFMPYVQYYRDDNFRKKKLNKEWNDLIRIFSRPGIMRGYCNAKATETR